MLSGIFKTVPSHGPFQNQLFGRVRESNSLIRVILYQDLLPQDLLSILVQSNRILMSYEDFLHMTGNRRHDIVLICHENKDGEALCRDRRREGIL